MARSRLGIAVAVSAILVALVGIAIAVLPSVGVALPFTSSLARCPAMFRNARLPFWFVKRLPRVLGGRSLPPARGFDSITRLPLWEPEDIASYLASPLILLALNGDVFDVTEKGERFYGPTSGYALFAGKDATRSLTLGSLDTSDLDLRGDVSDFTPAQEGELREQHKFYTEKYGPAVGHILGRSGLVTHAAGG